MYRVHKLHPFSAAGHHVPSYFGRGLGSRLFVPGGVISLAITACLNLDSLIFHTDTSLCRVLSHLGPSPVNRR